jgi:hypothetical protein
MLKRGLTGFWPFCMRSMVPILSKFFKSRVQDVVTRKLLVAPNPKIQNNEVQSMRSMALVASHPMVATPLELMNAKR